VSFQERVFVSTTGTVEMVPTAARPKETTEGLAVTATLSTPEPATGSGRMEFSAPLMNLISPPVQPTFAGVKLTVISRLCPGSKTSGRLRDDTVNAELLAVTPEIVVLVCPMLVTVTGKVSI
jgi:hypothetical protein